MILSGRDEDYRPHLPEPSVVQRITLRAGMLDASADPSVELFAAVNLLREMADREMAQAHEVYEPQGPGWLELTWVRPLRAMEIIYLPGDEPVEIETPSWPATEPAGPYERDVDPAQQPPRQMRIGS